MPLNQLLKAPSIKITSVVTNKRIFRLKQSYSIGTLNCRSLNSEFVQGELKLHINQHNLQAACIQEHHLLHKDNDPNIISHEIGHSILFTALTYKITNNATMRGVGITVRKQILPLLTAIKKVDSRILIASFKGNPKTVLVSCYSPYNLASLEEVEKFYEQVSNLISTIPSHNNLIIGGDFNARISGKFLYHSVVNRNVNSLKLSSNNTIFWPVTRFFKNLTGNYGHRDTWLKMTIFFSENAGETVLMTAKPILLLLLEVITTQ